VVDEFLLLVHFDVYPFIDVQIVFVEMIADVLEPYIPSAGLDALFLLNELVAEAAPEVVVAFAAQVHVAALFLYLFGAGLKSMTGCKVLGKLLLVMREVAASRVTLQTFDLAAPHFGEEVLRVLVAFPVVTAAEALGTFREGAAVGTTVPFHVLSEIALALLDLVASWFWTGVLAFGVTGADGGTHSGAHGGADGCM
jgi:hypothetical protein